eukprot:TRINITY_DN63920_c0_g1_i2.p1 TRINITY_DN63920_c0_g1~~TRINITY_DN63920_c0_g1_i2.p1  ORF type:complete len:300 (+),score=39.16 TRINITY_DN63920_c0_g1_i2:26-901(+)
MGNSPVSPVSKRVPFGQPPKEVEGGDVMCIKVNDAWQCTNVALCRHNKCLVGDPFTSSNSAQMYRMFWDSKGPWVHKVGKVVKRDPNSNLALVRLKQGQYQSKECHWNGVPLLRGKTPVFGEELHAAPHHVGKTTGKPELWKGYRTGHVDTRPDVTWVQRTDSSRKTENASSTGALWVDRQQKVAKGVHGGAPATGQHSANEPWAKQWQSCIGWDQICATFAEFCVFWHQCAPSLEDPGAKKFIKFTEAEDGNGPVCAPIPAIPASQVRKWEPAPNKEEQALLKKKKAGGA